MLLSVNCQLMLWIHINVNCGCTQINTNFMFTCGILCLNMALGKYENWRCVIMCNNPWT